MFIEKIEKWLKAKFNENTMEAIRYVMKNKGTCVIELIMFYDNKETKQKKVYRVLICVLYSLIYNHVWIDYL